MAKLPASDVAFEIGHVLFLDIVGYSRLLISEQSARVVELNDVVRQSDEFCRAEGAGSLIRLPSGDGMALVFSSTVETALRCAIEIALELKGHAQLAVRMGIHSGPVKTVRDVNDQTNVAGAGINVAQRVMACGDAGHILLSRHAADDLEQYPRWRSHLHDLGEHEVKHGVRLGLVGFWEEGIGNSEIPARLRGGHLTPRPQRRGRLLSLAGAAAAAMAAVGYFFGPWSAPHAVGKSIAVLPFENLSVYPDNAYFAGGIQQDVLTNLAKIGDLKVISQASVAHYDGHLGDAREIGRALGVATVLTGSVRREANRVRINVQLINATDSEHLWAEDYDRELTDILAVQSEVALKIAAALQSKLSPTEKARLSKPPTESGEAYLLYLQASDRDSHSDLEGAFALYEKAIALDPRFALAFARLSLVASAVYQTTADRAYLTKAETAAQEALRLQPTLPEAHMAAGFTYYRGEHDYANALRELEIARAGLPNDSEVFLILGSIERRQGNWEQSTRDLRKAATLNPKVGMLWANLGANYRAQRDYDAATKIFEKGVASEPGFFSNYWLAAYTAIDRNADLSRLNRVVAMKIEAGTAAEANYVRYTAAILRRDFNGARSIVEDAEGEEQIYAWQVPTPFPRSLLAGLSYLLAGDRAAARPYLESAAKDLEKSVRRNAGDASRRVLLGEAYAGLGLKDKATAEGRRATELLSEKADAFEGPRITLELARIYSLLGDADNAIPLLEHCLRTPGGTTPSWLTLDPIWDPLRHDIRFQRLLTQNVPPTTKNQNN